MKADMHTHSVYSDGYYTPEEIAMRAKERGLGFIVITDHDNMDGAERKLRAARDLGLATVTGFEISAYEGYKVHVLGYGCDPQSPAYLQFLQSRIDGSYRRAEDILRKLKENFGVCLTLAQVEQERKIPTSPLHTMHIARAIFRFYGEKLGCADEGAVYLKCLAHGQGGYSDLCRPSPEEAVRVIAASGGISSLAHPGRIERTPSEREELFLRLVAVGLNGIECVYPTHTVSETEEFTAFAKAHGLFVTGGSDTHRDGAGRTIGSPVFEPSEALCNALRL